MSGLELALLIILCVDGLLLGLQMFDRALAPRYYMSAAPTLGGLALVLAVLRRMRLRSFALVSDSELIFATDARNISRYPMRDLTIEADSNGEPRIVHAGVHVRPPFIGRNRDFDSWFWREVTRRLVARLENRGARP